MKGLLAISFLSLCFRTTFKHPVLFFSFLSGREMLSGVFRYQIFQKVVQLQESKDSVAKISITQ